ncbi:MAG: SWIM zinc finger family protein [Adhaeribacter sp.]
MNWSEEQVLALSPDASSTKSGKDLARPEKWLTLAIGEGAMWGEIKGSGSTPYRAQIDLQNIAFKCSCPSRKFPCKHGLGLFLIYARKPDVFTTANPPDWVTEWLDKRQAKAEKKEEAPAKAPDPTAQTKRIEAREVKILAGLEEVDLWIKDLIRSGLIAVPDKSHAFWQNPAARMVDAQAPGVANLIRSLGELAYFQEGWQTPLLQRLIQIYLVTQAYPNLSKLPENIQADLRALVGWTQNQEELKTQTGTKDTWLVLAKQTAEEANIYMQTYWLYGQASGQFATVLNFYHQSKPTDLGLITGTALEAELVFYPGSYALRALIKEQKRTVSIPELTDFATLSAIQNQFAQVISVYPWQNSIPALAQLTPFLHQDKWFVTDNENRFVPLDKSFNKPWQLLALSGGYPLNLFGLYGRSAFLPLAMWHQDYYLTF